MDYNNTLQWMFSQLPMYQRQGKTAFKKDLTNSIALANHLGNPQLNYNTIHVAGTNGKGSTSHMIASILQEAGYNVGLYTSPHLKDFRERIKINGKPISKDEVINFIAENRTFLEQQNLSFFEMTVGMAFQAFNIHKVDIAVIEVGLGGRLDSTNIINPLVSVITNIGFDHTQFLGNTLIEIAREKAGIIKQNTPVVIGEYQLEIQSEFSNIAKLNNAPIYFAYKNEALFKTDLKGSYQKHNVKTAFEAIEIIRKKGFNIPLKAITNGFLNVVNNTHLLGRWQILQSYPKIICDTGHNKEGLTYVLTQIKKESYNKLHIIIGVVNDKNLASIIPLFPKNASYYFCKPDIPRGLNENILAQEFKKFNILGDTFSSVKEALNKATKIAKKNDLIFIGGSTFVVAECL
ncbi:MAG: bifunctional folylpolyglutamate synthase/dihydrofolate synthase [Lutibacter sp.]